MDRGSLISRSKLTAATVAAAMVVATFAMMNASMASIHLVYIKKIFPGTPNQPNAQFIELQMFSSGQNFSANSEIAIYNSGGTKVGSFRFPANVANGADLSSLLAATSEAQSAFTIAADLTINAVIDPAGGKACFSGSGDCASWGSFSGSSAGVGATGTPFNASEGLVRGAMMERKITGGSSPTRLDGGDDTNDSASDFELTAPPLPRNNVGATGAHCCSAGFLQASTSASEGGSVSISVSRSPSSGSLSVDYATSNGTAWSGTDYVSTSGTLSFADGEAMKSFNVQTLSDGETEYDETVNLRLRALSGGVYSRVVASIKIIGDLPTTVPSAPTSPSASAGPGMGQISLAWAAPSTDGGSAITNYKIYRGSNPSAMALLKTLPSGTFSYIDPNLPPGRLLHYKFTAVNSLGEGPASATVSATTFADKPAAPTSPQALPSGAGQTTITWAGAANNGSAISYYKVYRGTSSGVLTYLDRTSGPGTSYIDRTCRIATVCYYKVSAVNGIGEGPLSAEVFMAGSSL